MPYSSSYITESWLNDWPYRSRSKVIVHDTSSHANDNFYQKWVEYIQNCRSYKAYTACGVDRWTDGMKPIYPQKLCCAGLYDKTGPIQRLLSQHSEYWWFGALDKVLSIPPWISSYLWVKQIEALWKLLSFCRKHYKICVLEWKHWYFYANFNNICSQGKIDNKSTLVKLMVCSLTGNIPLPETMLTKKT